MKTFNINPLSAELKEAIQHKIDNKTKPIGALGVLEEIAAKVAMIQNTLTPELNNPAVVVFAGDHGIAKDGIVNPYPQEVTYQMVLNFLQGGAAINVFTCQNEISLDVVDAGVNFDFDKNVKLIHAKIAKGTRNYLCEPAMTNEECERAIDKGAEIVNQKFNSGSNVISFGEMGIGNTSSASLIMSAITDLPIEYCVGKGTGLNVEGVAKKINVLEKVFSTYNLNKCSEPLEILSTFGGYEIAMICGAYLQAAENKMLILVDGFISTAALMIASKINSSVLDYCIFSHVSDEQGHKRMLEYFHVNAIVNFNMRLGEGTGVAVVYPIIKSAVAFLNEMASFESANVSKS